jgi:KDO2-lipid IV(A) lauroyltransferase
MTPKACAYRAIRQASLRLPAEAAFRLADRLGALWGRLARRDRAHVLRNLSVLGRPQAEAADVFRNFGRYLVEFFTIHRVRRPDVAVEGLEHLRGAQQARRGTLVLTGHLGNWEVGAVVLRRMGFPMTVVALPHADRSMDALFNAQRRRCDLEIIPTGPSAARQALRQLRRGGLLGLLGDREFGSNGLPVPVAGASMVLPRGPALLSIRSGAPVLPVFLVREGLWRFRLCIEPPLWPAARDSEEAVPALMQAYAQVLGRYLSRFAEQWLMFQPAFETAA